LKKKRGSKRGASPLALKVGPGRMKGNFRAFGKEKEKKKNTRIAGKTPAGEKKVVVVCPVQDRAPNKGRERRRKKKRTDFSQGKKEFRGEGH